MVGGGDVALDAARSAIRLQRAAGLEPDVTLTYRRTQVEMPANASELEEARDEGLKVEFLALPLEVLAAGHAGAGDAGAGEAARSAGDAASGTAGRVAGMRLQRCKLGRPDSSGRRQPVPVEGKLFELAADTVIFAVGQQLVDDFLNGCDGVQAQGRPPRLRPGDDDDRQAGRVRRRRRGPRRLPDRDRSRGGRTPRRGRHPQLPARRGAASGLGDRTRRGPAGRGDAGGDAPPASRARPDARRDRSQRDVGGSQPELQRRAGRWPRRAAAWTAPSAPSAAPVRSPARPTPSTSTSRPPKKRSPSAPC